MFRKIVIIITIFSFLLALISCTTYSFKKSSVEKAMEKQMQKKERIDVLELETKQGKKYTFSKEKPGQLGKDGIRVKSQEYEKVEIKKSDIEKMVMGKEGQSRLITKDGKTIPFTSFLEKEDRLIFITTEEKATEISYTDISWVKIIRKDMLKSLVVSAAVLTFVLFLVGKKIEHDMNEWEEEHCAGTWAARGTSLYPRLSIIREFRDKYLLRSEPGRVFVKLYYQWSSYWSKLIQRDEKLMNLTRIGLVPLIAFCQLMNQTLELS